MGFGHSWKLERDLSEKEWTTIVSNLKELTNHMPEVVKMRHDHSIISKFIHRNDKGYSIDFENQMSNIADQNKIVICPDPKEIRSRAVPFVFSRTAHEGWVRSNAAVYDFLNVSTMLLVNHIAPNSLNIKYSDAEPAYFEYISEFASNKLGFSINKMDHPKEKIEEEMEEEFDKEIHDNGPTI